MAQLREKAIHGLRVGETISRQRTFTREDVTRFADITRDYNPVHFDERFTRVKGLRGTVCHGLLVASILTEIGGQLGWLASRMDLGFKKPVYVGDCITCELTIVEMNERGFVRGEAVFRNQDNLVVLEAGVWGVLPGPREQKVMETMLAEGDPSNKCS